MLHMLYIDIWQTIMSEHYAELGYNVVEKTLGTCGHQLAWTSNDMPVISVNFYPGKGKLMVQPGCRDSARLDEWLLQYATWKSKLPDDMDDIIDNRDESLMVHLTPLVPTAPAMDPREVTHVDVDDNMDVSGTLLVAPGKETSDNDAPLDNVALQPRLCCMCVTKLCNDDGRVCKECRHTPGQIKSLVDTVATLTGLVRGLVTQNDKLITKNDLLQQSVGNLSQKLDALTWKSFNSNGTRNVKQQDLLIGSSIIRDIDQTKLLNTEVICVKGGTITSVKEHLESTHEDYERITIAVGGNDCDAKQSKSPDAIVKSYRNLINTAKGKAKNISVSGICPRLTSEATQDTIDATNAGLNVMCSEEEQVSYVDNTTSFKLADGSANDGYYLADGIHITRAGTNKLAKNLNLRLMDQAEGACRNSTQSPSNSTGNRDISKRPTQHSHWNRTPSDDDGWHTQVSRRDRGARRNRTPSDDDGWHTQVSRRDRGTRRDSRCQYCGEEGHDSGTCRHGRPVVCHTCNHTGHKAKFCGSSK